MTTRHIATKLVELCRKNENMKAVEELYADDIVSLEAATPPGDPMPREMRGKQAIIGKTKWWFDNHDIHGVSVGPPQFNGDNKFACTMELDVTFKPTGKRMKVSEIAVYTVANGKIVHEEFYYDMGG